MPGIFSAMQIAYEVPLYMALLAPALLAGTWSLEEMARCTKADGSILIGTLNRLSPLNRKRLARGQEPYASGRLLAPHELCDLLAPFGTVRMIATSVQDGAASAGAVVRRLEARPEMLSGPFLVAEVRKRL